MTFEIILSWIKDVGFPIAMVLLLMWYIYKSTQQHKEEVTELRKALDNNTLAIQKMSDRLERLDNGK